MSLEFENVGEFIHLGKVSSGPPGKQAFPSLLVGIFLHCDWSLA